ncbi:amidohydrolase [Rhexocercosporidium sp. MPI-PUGE-AT-0058]|nr:amidohydrolase [Rhexocercosporidium sp. MPI-PUGE-AT-0058]
MTLSVQSLPGGSTAGVTNSTIFLQGGTIVTYSKASNSVEILRNSSIFIQDYRMISIGETPSLEVLAKAEVINLEGKIVSPSFIDTHRHGWQTEYKTNGSNTTLASKVFTVEDVYIGQLTSIYESLNAGVTSILDHVSHVWSKETFKVGLKPSVDSGARVWWAYAIHDVGSSFTIDDRFEDLEKLARDEERLLKGSSTSVGLEYGGDLDLSVITTHYVGAYGDTNSVELLDSYSALESKTPIVFSHASALTETDTALLRKHNQFISINQAALGVDTHFSFSSDMILQARLWLQATRLRLYRKVLADAKAPVNNPMSVNQAFLLATRNGAMALRRDDLGIIERGAKSHYPALLYWGYEHILIDRKFKKRDGEFVVDCEGMKERFLPSAERIQKIWAETE